MVLLRGVLELVSQVAFRCHKCHTENFDGLASEGPLATKGFYTCRKCGTKYIISVSVDYEESR